MEAKFLAKEKEVVEVQLNDCDEGLARLIVDKLSDDKKVGYAAVSLDHPLTNNPIIHVRAGNAKEALEKAVEASLEEIEAAGKKAKQLA